MNKVHFINEHALYLIKSGSGTIEVDFQNYSDWEDKAIYLAQGQYIKFLSEDFEVFRITFPNVESFNSPDIRVLFKHLISLGYINLQECKECHEFLSAGVFSDKVEHILDISSDQWYWQNPFQANREEYQIIFDLKETLDQEYLHTINSHQLTANLNADGLNVNKLVQDKLGITVGNMLAHKRTLESKKKIAFSDKNIQEIAFETGFKDPGYFNRAFKNTTGQTPKEFRNNFVFPERETFVLDILELLKTHHQKEHKLDFYADKMHMSVSTLSKKVKEKLHTSISLLIRHEILSSAKTILRQGQSVKDTAWQLGFEEPQHFSNFFKHYSGQTPTAFLKS